MVWILGILVNKTTYERETIQDQNALDVQQMLKARFGVRGATYVDNDDIRHNVDYTYRVAPIVFCLLF